MKFDKFLQVERPSLFNLILHHMSDNSAFPDAKYTLEFILKGNSSAIIHLSNKNSIFAARKFRYGLF